MDDNASRDDGIMIASIEHTKNRKVTQNLSLSCWSNNSENEKKMQCSKCSQTNIHGLCCVLCKL